MNKNYSVGAIVACIISALSCQIQAESKNGFSLDGALIPVDEIHFGGPPKDGIPALDNPEFVPAGRANFLQPNDRVLALRRNGVAKAYPLRILNWHEIVNDRFGDEAITIVYCPLCGSGTASRAKIGDQLLTFGVSGLLYNSDVLMYDRQTQSLWSQIQAQAVTGPMKGARLTGVSVIHTTWKDWFFRHPDTLVLSLETGYQRNYDANPYQGYDQDNSIMFPVRFRSEGYHPKEPVLGLVLDGSAKAYPFIELEKTVSETSNDAPVEIADELAGYSIRVRYDATHRSVEVFDEKGEAIPGVTLFWFAWYAFHPETAVYRFEKSN
ncbi:MAG: DUF3179 domain-containing protein [Burkholderiales bacterium]|nr:DUF3179 domain-containing protein [Burkholderiales bacterium]MDR4518636.1 DUF3179 domain-containing protein [Nitrosomonas sp.]